MNYFLKNKRFSGNNNKYYKNKTHGVEQFATIVIQISTTNKGLKAKNLAKGLQLPASQ